MVAMRVGRISRGFIDSPCQRTTGTRPRGSQTRYGCLHGHGIWFSVCSVEKRSIFRARLDPVAAAPGTDTVWGYCPHRLLPTAFWLVLTSSVPPSRRRPNNTGDDGRLARAWRAVLWPKQLPYRSDSNRDRNSASIARLIDR